MATTSPANLDAIVLVVSELVTNAVVHAQSQMKLTVRDLGHCARVEVRDGSTRVPEMRPANAEHGRGLNIVEVLATRWGVDRHRNGKTVWFEIENPARTDPLR